MRITIKPVANTGLYRDLQASVNQCATTHRTISGAFRGLVALNNRARNVWAQSMGQWGTFEVLVNGRQVDHDELGALLMDMDDRDPVIAPSETFRKIVENTIAEEAE